MKKVQGNSTHSYSVKLTHAHSYHMHVYFHGYSSISAVCIKQIPRYCLSLYEHWVHVKFRENLPFKIHARFPTVHPSWTPTFFFSDCTSDSLFGWTKSTKSIQYNTVELKLNEIWMSKLALMCDGYRLWHIIALRSQSLFAYSPVFERIALIR